jgi:hypothetical protein
MKKIVQIQNEKIFNLKNKEYLPFVTTWMNLEDIRTSEINQTQKSKS